MTAFLKNLEKSYHLYVIKRYIYTRIILGKVILNDILKRTYRQIVLNSANPI